MADATIYHNPNCSSSVHAVGVAADVGLDVEIVQYLKHPLDAETLGRIVEIFDGEVTDLVRRDNTWKALGLTDADVAAPEQVIAVLVANPKLLQRPLIVTTDRAFIGRPKDEVRAMLGALGA